MLSQKRRRTRGGYADSVDPNWAQRFEAICLRLQDSNAACDSDFDVTVADGLLVLSGSAAKLAADEIRERLPVMRPRVGSRQ